MALTCVGTKSGAAQAEPFQWYSAVWQRSLLPEPVHDSGPEIQASEALSTAASLGMTPAGRGTSCQLVPFQRGD
jgi:hypothetical protein